MNYRSKLLLPLVTTSAIVTMSSNAALIFHSSMDNIDVGAGAGTDTTSAGTYSVGNSVGANGVAGGNANTTPVATTGGHVTSGTSGQIGQAVSFPGNGNAGVRYDGIANAGTGGYSVSLWFNFNGNAQNGMLAAMGNTGSSGEGWSVFYENGSLIYRMSVGGGGSDLRAAVNTTIANDSNWHHAALVIDPTGGVINGYLDGVAATGIGSGGPPDGTFVSDGDGVANGDPLFLGVRGSGGFQFRGDLDDVAIWDESLDSTAVSGIYQNGLSGIGVGIPEPSSLVMVCLGMSGLLRRRRK
ncbi:PEP-CTERM sorting domain-containing protein [Akkermansiaceae bacterium]|nr:PEP-CTERM sorting domain-containing protein [Akkermansiaceae bacterium]